MAPEPSVSMAANCPGSATSDRDSISCPNSPSSIVPELSASSSEKSVLLSLSDLATRSSTAGIFLARPAFFFLASFGSASTFAARSAAAMYISRPSVLRPALSDATAALSSATASVKLPFLLPASTFVTASAPAVEQAVDPGRDRLPLALALAPARELARAQA